MKNVFIEFASFIMHYTQLKVQLKKKNQNTSLFNRLRQYRLFEYVNYYYSFYVKQREADDIYVYSGTFNYFDVVIKLCCMNCDSMLF